MNTRASVLVVAAGLLVGCSALMRGSPPVTPPTPPTPAQVAELWVEPEPGRDLFWGVGGERLKPDPSVTYTVIEIKQGGFSRGFTVTDPSGRKWSAKLPP